MYKNEWSLAKSQLDNSKVTKFLFVALLKRNVINKQLTRMWLKKGGGVLWTFTTLPMQNRVNSIHSLGRRSKANLTNLFRGMIFIPNFLILPFHPKETF